MIINRVNLNKLAKWSGFCGIMFIVFGTLTAIGGLFVFIIGAIPGILTLIMGIELLGAQKQINFMLVQPDGMDNSVNVDSVFSKYKVYLQLQGIIFIITILLCLLFSVIIVHQIFLVVNVINHATDSIGDFSSILDSILTFFN